LASELPLALTRRRLGAVLLLLAGVFASAIVLGATFGATQAPLAELLSGRLSAVERAILLEVRLPRVLLAAVLGGALAVAGTVFQALLRNPLADPYVLGVSGGASLGGVVALLLGLGGASAPWGGVGVQALAFAGALGALLLIERIATVDGRMSVVTLLLTGAICNAVSGAAIFFLQSVASFEELHAMVFYLMGQVPSLGLRGVVATALVALGAALALWTMAGGYNALALGEDGARQLGVEVESLKRRTFALGSLLTALAVSLAGLIGFVGLIVPHILRLLLGADHRLLLPAAFLGGGAFLVVADLLARAIVAPNEVPVGVITALVGGPFFLVLLRRRRSEVPLG
jgi:iron complex transport system permease protein